MMTLKEAVINLLLKYSPYINRGYGQFNCSSCGALKTVDYDEQSTTEKEEEHSRNCPWRILKESLNNE